MVPRLLHQSSTVGARDTCVDATAQATASATHRSWGCHDTRARALIRAYTSVFPTVFGLFEAYCDPRQAIDVGVGRRFGQQETVTFGQRGKRVIL